MMRRMMHKQDEGELLEFAKGLLGDDGAAFVADLRETRAAAAAIKAAGPGNGASGAAPPSAGGKTQKKGGGGGQGGYMTGGPDDRRLSKGGATNLRDLSGQRAREAEEAAARLERNLQAASSSKVGSKVDLSMLAPEEGMTAYMKADDLDVLGIAGMKREPKKKGSHSKNMHALAHAAGSEGGDENAMPVYQKPKTSRAQRAQMLHANSDLAFLAPGRHHCTWVGNGGEYKLVGNCLDCGKILSNQEVCSVLTTLWRALAHGVCVYRARAHTLQGEGPCLVCGSEQVYLASTNAMLDGTPVDQVCCSRDGGAEESRVGGFVSGRAGNAQSKRRPRRVAWSLGV
jgi:hypothetical protein